jgi:hypothetical protein
MVQADPDDQRLQVIVDYRPCATCAAEREQGVFIAEVSTEPMSPDQPSILEGLPGSQLKLGMTDEPGPAVYPTGNWLVFDPAGLAEIFDEDIVRAADRDGHLLFGVEMYRAAFPPEMLRELEAERSLQIN